MRTTLLVNPVAGQGRAGRLSEGLRTALAAGGDEVQVLATQAAGDAARLCRELAPGATDRLVVVGGDGTLREVVGARDLPLPWPVGLAPVGTANVVARELGMPRCGKAERVAAALRTAVPWPVGVLEIAYADGRRERALANVGAGLDAEVVRAVAAARAARGGRGGYRVWVRPLLGTLWRYEAPRLQVALDGGAPLPAAALVVQGARNYGGLFELSPRARMDAPTLSVARLTRACRRDLLALLLRGLLRRAHRSPHLSLHEALTLHVTADRPVGLQADGDAAGLLPATNPLLELAFKM
ncbi:MAG: diacylglycerol/lipid kinase family protein [Planctomycetia bacterium]